MDKTYSDQIDALVERHQRAEGPLIKIANYAGGQVESILSKLPEEFDGHLQRVIQTALNTSYDISGSVKSNTAIFEVPSYFHKLAVTLSGGIGGFTGLAGSIAELPITITTMLASFQKIAEEYGFDRNEAETRLECLQIFSMGGPLDDDQDIDLSFLSARLALRGDVISNLIAQASNRIAVVISHKLGTQAVPVLGAVSGAALNFTFMSYYEEMAHVRFTLKKLQNCNENRNTFEDFIFAYKRSKNVL